MRKRIILMLLSALVLLTGCSGTSGEAPNNEIGKLVDSSLSQENVRFVAASSAPDYLPDASENGLYFSSEGKLSYYDLSTDSSVILCAQSGCAHSDAGCPAWLGNAESFCVYDGYLYVLKKTANNGLMLEQVELGQSARREICRMTAAEHTSLHLSNAFCAYGKIFLSVQENNLDTQKQNFVLYAVKLTDGSISTLATDSDTETFRFLGASATLAAVQCNVSAGQPPLETDYPTFDAYVAACEQYYTENTTVQLRLYDLAAGSYEVLADSRSDSFSYSPDPHLCAGDQLVYLLGEELWIYDLTAHTAALCMTQANIKNYFVMDHKIFTNTSKDGLSYQFFYTDLDRGTPVEQANGDYAAYRLFAVSCETASKFIGLDKDGTWCQIDKTDYYAEAFDKAQPLRP